MNQVATQQSGNPLVRFKQNLGRVIDAKELALPTNVSTDAFRNAAVVAVQDNPKILQCDEASVFKSLRTLAAAGLVPDGREAALVPFKTKDGNNWIDKCQAMPMVFGLIKMVRRSGTVKDVRAHLVYQREIDEGRFEYIVGDEERLRHEPILFGDRGDPVACYAIAVLTDGSIVREFMSSEEVEKVRRSSAAQKLYERGKPPKVSEKPIGIWKDWGPEMWKKSVIRRICKRLDMSSEDMRRVMVEEDTPPSIRDVTPEERPTLAQRLAQRDQEPDQPDTPDTDDKPLDGEIMDDTGKHWTDLVKTDDAAPMDPGFEEGAKAFKDGAARTECPQGDDAAAWLAGWDQQKAFAEQEEEA